MLKMRFDTNWVAALMKCISTVSYSVVINGHNGDKFFPTRGLRQVDPFSPFSILLYVEGLSSLLLLAMNRSFFLGC